MSSAHTATPFWNLEWLHEWRMGWMGEDHIQTRQKPLLALKIHELQWNSIENHTCWNFKCMQNENNRKTRLLFSLPRISVKVYLFTQLTPTEYLLSVRHYYTLRIKHIETFSGSHNMQIYNIVAPNSICNLYCDFGFWAFCVDQYASTSSY